MQALPQNKDVGGELVRLGEGIYVNGKSGGTRVKIKSSAVGLVVGRYGPQILVAIDDDKVVLVSERACEKLQ